MTSDWTARAGTRFTTQKRPAMGSRGMVVTNHPLASAAGAEMLAAGGNAFDGAIAALFALTRGRTDDGRAARRRHRASAPGRRHAHRSSTAWRAAPPPRGPTCSRRRSRTIRATSRRWAAPTRWAGCRSATPGNLKAWCEILERFGSLPLADVMAPAIRHAEHGFRATPYLAECAAEAAPDLARDPAIAAIYLPGGAPLQPGHRVVQGDYAQTLQAVAQQGRGGDRRRAGRCGGRRASRGRAASSPPPTCATTAPSSARRCADPIATWRWCCRRRRRPPACMCCRC